jgi:prevent-host-death family protein
VNYTIPATKARSSFFKILEDVDAPNKTYTITQSGVPKAVILSFDEYESWVETLEILRDTKLMKEVKAAEEDFEKGEFIPLEEILKEEGYIPASKIKKVKCIK